VLELPENVPGGKRRRLLSLVITNGYWIGALGFVARFALWFVSEGTNDIRTWQRFANTIRTYGLGATYTYDPLFNHPPLMGMLAHATSLSSNRLGVPFAMAFKLYGILADLGSALLILHIWRRRGLRDRAVLAFAGYGWALSAILISGYHGNTDPVYWFLVLCSVYFLQDRSAPFSAGLFMGAALEVKLIPMLVVLPLAACCRDFMSFVRYGLGVAIALIPFAWIVLRLSAVDQASFARNVFGYTSYREFWGLELVLRALGAASATSLPTVARYIDMAGALWGELGSKILLALTTWLAAAHALRRYPGLDAYALASIAFCLFLVLASGFGVQYMGAVAPLLFACRVRDGFAVTTSSGVFIALIYASFVQTWSPIFSQHSYFSAGFAVPSFISWCLLLRAALRIWRTRYWPAPQHN
jgi:hypothetical protein